MSARKAWTDLEDDRPLKAVPTPRPQPRAPLRSDVALGTLFAGRFRIERFIARGGMGVVWEAIDTEAAGAGPGAGSEAFAGETQPARVALKIMTTLDDASPAAVERFRRESALVAALKGPHFPRVHASGVENGVPYLALELLEGETLQGKLARTKQLSPKECVSICRQICAALAEAHSLGVVHRDISPQNIFLLTSPLGAVKILDFGIAKHALFHAKLTEPGMLMGTPQYMSPEQIRKAQGVDARSDLWSTAAVLYRCLLGTPAFDGKSTNVLLRILTEAPAPPSTIANVGVAVDEFFETAFAKEPANRFPSAQALASLFEAALRALPSERPVSSIDDFAGSSDSAADDGGHTQIAQADYESYAGRASRWNGVATPPTGMAVLPKEVTMELEEGAMETWFPPARPHPRAAMPAIVPAPSAMPQINHAGEPRRARGGVPVPFVIGLMMLTSFVTWLLTAHR